MKKLGVITAILIIIAAVILLSGCIKILIPSIDDDDDNVVVTINQTLPMSVWVAYWDLSNAKEKIMEINEPITAISCFAAYFDENNNVFIPDKLTEFKNELMSEAESNSWDYYLTIVNDKTLGDKSLLKDTELLQTIFDNETSMRAHIKQLIDLAAGRGYQGIEIDYEAIRSDMDLWKKFIVFCNLLYKETEAADLKLRIIFEPNAPLEKLSFPDGPEYVMMCYNLYGTDTRKGPKANDRFLRDMLKKMDSLPGKKWFALATGGFHWVGNGKGNPITEKNAHELSTSTNATVYRSNDSGALTFQYRDEQEVENTIWYADNETLRHWKAIIQSGGGHGIMLWRIEADGDV